MTGRVWWAAGCIVVWCVAGVGPGAAATVDPGARLLAEGLAEYQLQHYDRALERFSRLTGLPAAADASAGQLLLGRTLFHLSRFDEARAAGLAVAQRFPTSRYVSDGLLLAGDSAVRSGQYATAGTLYARLLGASGATVNQARAAERLAALVSNGSLDGDAQHRLREDLGPARWRDALQFGQARWLGRLGRAADAETAMRRYRQAHPRGAFAAWAGDGASASALTRVGVLLPLTGAGRQTGEDLRAGAEWANEEAGRPFELVVADVGFDYGDLPVVESGASSILRVVSQTRHLIEDDQVDALIGPPFSADCAAAAALAQMAEVPFLAPLAQQSGLDSVGGSTYQLAVPPETQAGLLAGHATAVLGLRRLAILAPLTDYGWRFARELVQATQAGQGQIVYQDWYVAGETRDFSRFFAEIRRVGLQLAPDLPAASSTDTTAGGGETASMAGEPSAAATALGDGATAEVVTGVDGVAIVVESFDDARLVMPQIRYHQLQTQVLGNDTWYQPEALRLLPPEERAGFAGLLLVSGTDDARPPTRSFAEGFRRRYGRPPGYAAWGYDAVRLLASSMPARAGGPAGLAAGLAANRGFEGAAARVAFANGRRVNSALELLYVDESGAYRALGGAAAVPVPRR
jgi:ABC-type branched-subunit amino acid transport system substrate-binding protein